MRDVEGDFLRPAEQAPARAGSLRRALAGADGVHGLGVSALRAHEHGPVRAGPMTVAPSEPGLWAHTRPVRSGLPCSSSAVANRPAARTGRTVWEDDGPIPR